MIDFITSGWLRASANCCLSTSSPASKHRSITFEENFYIDNFKKFFKRASKISWSSSYSQFSIADWIA